MSAQNQTKSVTIATLQKKKAEGEPFSCLTAYDSAFATVLENAGIDVVLVGDSVGMVVQGRDTTIPVTLDEMIYHSQIVARGMKRPMLMADMPFMSYSTPKECLTNAAKLMKEGGAHIVKLEWGELQLDMVERLSECGVPVCAHLGLTPQAVYKIGGYRVQGRDDKTAERLREDALKLEAAGADILLLECVPMKLAAEVTKSAKIPVIGIGAGPDCDGQILVLYDILDIAPGKRTRFSKNYMQGAGSIESAVRSYVEEVESGTFPTAEYAFE